jgi:hypothetical protein
MSVAGTFRTSRGVEMSPLRPRITPPRLRPLDGIARGRGPAMGVDGREDRIDFRVLSRFKHGDASSGLWWRAEIACGRAALGESWVSFSWKGLSGAGGTAKTNQCGRSGSWRVRPARFRGRKPPPHCHRATAACLPARQGVPDHPVRQPQRRRERRGHGSRMKDLWYGAHQLGTSGEFRWLGLEPGWK